MNRGQKIAWSQLTVVGVLAVASVILTVLFARKYRYELQEAWWIGSGYATPLLVLTILAPVLIRKRKGRTDIDERDVMIDHRATLAAFGTTYVVFIGVCFTTWVAAGFDRPMPAYWLMRIVLGAWIASVVAHALATVVCYGRGGNEDE